MIRATPLLVFLTFALAAYAQAQKLREIDPELSNHRAWIETSHGPSRPRNDIFILGPSISIAWLTKNNTFMKFKTAYHLGPDFFVNFPQSAFEANLMMGLIQSKQGGSFEFHYGIGVITGTKRGEFISTTASMLFFDYMDHFEEVPFVTVGVPVELRYQFGKRIGIGFDGNINTKMPYFGIKIFTRFGIRKK